MLINGDCLIKMNNFADSSIDVIIADIPYGTTNCKWDSVLPLDVMWLQLKRIIKHNGAILLFAQTPFDKILGCSNIEMLKYEWIYEKISATGHLNAKKMPMKAHENILVFYNKLPKYNPQKTTGHSPVNTYVKRNDSDGECYGITSTAKGGGNTDRYPRSIQQFSSDKQKVKAHPTQKPLKLLEYLVKTYTDENDIVLDFTMGSGTTGVACKKLNRKFIGIELDKKYFDIAVNRINRT